VGGEDGAYTSSEVNNEPFITFHPFYEHSGKTLKSPAPGRSGAFCVWLDHLQIGDPVVVLFCYTKLFDLLFQFHIKGRYGIGQCIIPRIGDQVFRSFRTDKYEWINRGDNLTS